MSDGSEARPITLEMIEAHLKKQDRESINTNWFNVGAVCLTIIVSGATLIFSNACSAGVGFVVLGIFLFIAFPIYYKIRTHKKY